jgi:DNA polymerase I-like protein with 3'-5' exonuclease and polymerase domains
MRAPEVITIDFETEGIERRPEYPPVPVGVAIKEPGQKPFYMAWGHPCENNCSKRDAAVRLKKIWKDPRPKLFHNSKFDVDVAEMHFGLPRLAWDKYHDSMFLAFLDDPDRANVKLKDVAAEVLGKPPSERDALREWILENVKGSKKSDWGAYISRAPGGMVGRYAAQGDAESAAKLFAKLWTKCKARGMAGAYDRERRVMLPLLDSERRGIRVDIRRMERDLPYYEALLESADNMLRKILKAPDLDVDSRGASLADALDAAGKVDSWALTATGKRSTSKKTVIAGLNDLRLAGLLLYRGALATSVRTFIRPWLEMARQGKGGRIYTQWNQVRQAAGGDPIGARTGRLSSSPNFQNIPLYTRQALILPMMVKARLKMVDAAILRRFPFAGFEGAVPLPKIKDYVLPEKGEVLVERDYSQQEFRILAHFEDGALLEKYKDNPDLDVHDAARELIHSILGVMLERRPVKDVGFSLIYGMGLAELARKTEVSIEEAKGFKAAYLQAMPGIKELTAGLKELALNKEPITTWGGRQYFVEPARVVKGRLREFYYKLINRLIQGSAADCTKEGTARYEELGDTKRCGGKFLMTVHDSTVISAPKKTWKLADKALKDSMESVEFDVFMKTDGKYSATNLGALTKIKD